MNRQTVKQARAEALRFVDRCNELLDIVVDQYDPDTKSRIRLPWRSTTCGAPKQMGAVRRASMDLTRSLAAMRKPS